MTESDRDLETFLSVLGYLSSNLKTKYVLANTVGNRSEIAKSTSQTSAEASSQAHHHSLSSRSPTDNWPTFSAFFRSLHAPSCSRKTNEYQVRPRLVALREDGHQRNVGIFSVQHRRIVDLVQVVGVVGMLHLLQLQY